MKYIITAVPIMLCMSIAPIVYLWYLAFGVTRPDTVSVWAAFTLGCVTMIVVFTVFHSLDWINDLVAGRKVEKQNTSNSVELSRLVKGALDLARLQQTQQKMLPTPDQPKGGLGGTSIVDIDDPYMDIQNLD